MTTSVDDRWWAPTHAAIVGTTSYGLRYVIAPDDRLRTMAVSFMVNAGPCYESNDTLGLSHFLEHMLFRGNDDHPNARSLEAAIERLGADVGAYTSSDTIAVNASANRLAGEDLLPLVAGLTTTPRFPDIDIERGVVINELGDHLDENDPLYTLMPLAFAGAPIGRSILGTEPTLRRFDKAALVAHHQRHFAAANAAVCIAGGGVHPVEYWSGLIETMFAKLPTGGPLYASEAASQTERVVRVIDTKDKQTQVCIGVRAPRRSGDYHAMMAYASILSRRLHNLLISDRGLCYSAHVDYEAFSRDGLIMVSAAVRSADTAALLAAVFETMVDLRDRGPTPHEMQLYEEQRRRDAISTLDNPTEWAGVCALGALRASGLPSAPTVLEEHPSLAHLIPIPTRTRAPMVESPDVAARTQRTLIDIFQFWVRPDALTVVVQGQTKWKAIDPVIRKALAFR